MANLTQNCDVFASFHEEGFNKIISHIMQQRPSLFNYGTARFIKEPKLMCRPINAIAEVSKRGNPLITVQPPLPIFGTNPLLGLEFSFQLADFTIDFAKSNLIQLPPELKPDLQNQQLALKIGVCGGICCPNQDAIKRFLPTQTSYFDTLDLQKPNRDIIQPKGDPIPLPSDKLNCFCIDIYAKAEMVRNLHNGKEYLSISIINTEIVDITPAGLEDSLECYITSLLRFSILPKINISVEAIAFNIFDFAHLFLTPLSAAVPANPSIADDQLSIFMNLN